MSDTDVDNNNNPPADGDDDRHEDESVRQGRTERTKPITVRVDGGGQRAQLSIGTINDQRFVLEKVLGRGGMSVVYRARDLLKEQARDPNPYGAIKILGTEFSEDPDSWVSLQREAKKAQSLAHPRIVTVHDFQIDRDSGLPFVYMEELQGESLDSVLKKNPDGLADRRQAIDIIFSIADGLDCAHNQGIVHSDLKPSNIFLTEESQVKILDFGIARAVPGSDRDDFDAGFMGALTPAYASCEMFDGEPAHPSDDLYALGIIAYELLTGRHPYQDVLEEKNPALAARERHLKPARPAGLNRRQWHALQECLSLERKDRPANAAEFRSHFRLRNPLSGYLALGVLALSGVLIWALWFRVAELTPAEPFDELPLAQQEKFHKAMESGWTAYKYRDYNGALIYFAQAHDIHPHNPEAEEGLDKLVENVVSQAPAQDRASLERALEQVSVLLSYDAMAERRELIEYRDELVDGLAR